ncbi:MAG: PilZ domain-containing protein [bacterium]|nr:PilZ domain-containing protein [bacterium]
MITAVILAVTTPPKGYLNIESGSIDFNGPLQWILLLAVLGGLAHLTYWLVTKTLRERHAQRAESERQESRSDSFRERAESLGFRRGEAKTVERIARRLAPKSPLNLFNSSQGREYLISDLERRIATREREIKTLVRLKERLAALRESDVHERNSVRVEAGIAVWVSKRGLSNQEMAALVDDEDEAEGEGMFANLDSVSGRLLDISEGGAAIEVDMDIVRGDQVRFWSGDPKILLGETSAGVISTEQTDTARILHVHFIDPNLRDLRSAILQLRGEESE